MNRTITMLCTGLAALGLLAGCTKDAQEQYGQANQKASEASGEAAQAMKTDAKESGAAVEKGAKDTSAKVVAGTEAAGKAVANSTKEAGKAVANTGVTGKVKSAMLTASGLDASGINVDTVGNTVYLKGTVPDAKQKTQAEEIAKTQVSGDQKVVNQLTVAGSSK